MKPLLALLLGLAFATPALAGCPAYDPNCKPECPKGEECK
jgi:hypothetical protein